MPENLLTVCGLSSVRAVAAETPELIERLFFDDTHAPLFSEACRFLAQERKTYRLVTGDELRKITDTTHHQGAAAVIHLPVMQKLSGAKFAGHTLCLNDVMNPHNVGAIVRTAAFFGVQNLIVSRKSYEAAMTQAAWRVAEGGLTHTTLWVYDDTEEFFSWATGAYRTLAAIKPEAKKMRSLGEFIRDKNTQPLIVCLGNEEDGLPAAFSGRCNGRFSIAGSGRIESLNVSVTAALCIDRITAFSP